MQNSIIVNHSSNPYYIYAPSYCNTSAGVKVLHLLCHNLNLKGFPAFLATSKEFIYQTNPTLITPIVTDEVLALHKKNNKTPIVVYPDIVKGNPLNANCTVRYLLYYAGIFGGSSSFSKEDLVFTYTKKIGQRLANQTSQTLFMPICDSDIFYPPTDSKPRKGNCFYASKYKKLPEAKLLDLTKDTIEITRDLPNSQTTSEVADLLRRSECFYTYEDTSLITEAILCGCPVVLIKNEFFDQPLASYELGSEGCTFDPSPKGLSEARESIPIAQEKFFASIEKFWTQLDDFISATQELSLKSDNIESDIKLLKRQKKTMPIGRVIKNKLQNLIT